MTAHDVVVRGGSVTDGNGGPPVTADVAVGGRDTYTDGELHGRLLRGPAPRPPGDRPSARADGQHCPPTLAITG